jgi:hypothetical protein
MRGRRGRSDLGKALLESLPFFFRLVGDVIPCGPFMSGTTLRSPGS